MDNITHTLAGVLLGEAVARYLPSSSDLNEGTRRGLLIAVGVIGSNLPDTDFIYSLITGSKLDYLWQHRGYSHTLVGAVLGAVLLALLAELWCRWRRVRPSAGDRWAFAGVALCALILHITMDFTNNYGVHPFWPFYNGWVYGDSVFIVEPALWIAAAPLLFLMRSRIVRSLIALVLIASMVLSFGSGWIHAPNAIVLVALLVTLLAIGRRAAPNRALAAALAAWVAITAIFVASSQLAAKEVARASAAMYPEQVLLDHVLTPMPANPLCWDVIAVVAQGSDYGLRRGVLSLAPFLLSPKDCDDKNLQAATTAPLQPATQPGSAAIHWQDEWQMPQQRLAALVRDHCEAQVLMRFARAPFVRTDPRLILGDLRYDRDASGGFAAVELKNAPSRCARAPPWIPPRQEILAPKRE